MRKIVFLIMLFLPILGMAQDIKVKLPEESDFGILVNAGVLPKTARLLSCDKDCLTLISNGKMLALNNDSVCSYGNVPQEVLKSENIVNCKGTLFYKEDNFIKAWCNDTVMKWFKMPDANFSIYPSIDDVLFLVVYKDGKSQINIFDIKTCIVIPFIEMPFKIKCFSANSLDIFVSDTKSVYYISKKMALKIMTFDSEIKSLCADACGVFYSTKKSTGYIGTLDASLDMLKGGVKSMVSDGNKLYMLFDNGMIAFINNIGEFAKLYDTDKEKQE